MLCSKCGYITFDKQDACPKCRKDWSGIAEKLNATSTAIESTCFLGRVIGEEQGVPEDVAPDLGLEEDLVSMPDGADALDIAEPEAALDSLPDIELPEVELPEVELPEVELAEVDLPDNELSEIDLAKIDTQGAEVEDKTSPAMPESGEVALQLDTEAVDSAEPPVPEADLELREPPALKVDSVGSETGLDLNDIDLSDLVTQDEGDSPSSSSSESQELDLDLSSLEIEENAGGMDGIDLDLGDDDDDLNLSLELEPEQKTPAPKKSETAIPDLGLSLELDD